MLPLIAGIAQIVVMLGVSRETLRLIRQQRLGDVAQAKQSMRKIVGYAGLLAVATVATFYIFFTRLTEGQAIFVSSLIIAAMSCLALLVVLDGRKVGRVQSSE